MDNKLKKSTEELLINSTHEIFKKLDSTVSFLISKNIKKYSKDLTKKFFKTQKLLAKQIKDVEASQHKHIEAIKTPIVGKNKLPSNTMKLPTAITNQEKIIAVKPIAGKAKATAKKVAIKAIKK